MPSFHDVIVFLSLVSGLLILICTALVILYGIAIALRYLFEQYIKESWWGYNFDFKALFYISIPAVILFFGILPSDTNAPSFIEIQAFLFGVLLGFPVLIKRLWVMQEQAEKSQRQVEIGQQQIKIGQKQTRFNQYSEGKRLLWSEQLSSRIEGVEALWQFARTYPKQECQTVMDTFSQFIKHPLPYELDEKRQNNLKSVRPQCFKWETPAGKRKDIHAILQRMSERGMAGVVSYKINLSEAHIEVANLRMAYLNRANLCKAHLNGSDFCMARLEMVDLSEARLERVNFSHAHLNGSDLRGAHLDGSDLMAAHLKGTRLLEAHLDGVNLNQADLELAIINDADFKNAHNLKQEQVNECVLIKDSLGIPLYANKRPILPEGIEHTYSEMTLDEWEEAMKKLFPNEHFNFVL